MEKSHVKHTAKDSFFSSLALANDNLKKIYSLFILKILSLKIENVIFTGIYNDLSFTVRGKTIVFLEVQSTWSNNILLRFLRYYAELLPDMIDRYLRLQYKRKEKELELCKVFFSEIDNLNLKVKVLTKDNADGILKEYTEFCIIFDKCKKKYETAEEAIARTIEIAKERGLLSEFIRDREIEVMRMMSDDILWELEIKHYMENQRREDLEEGEEKGLQRGRQDGIEEGKLVALLSLVKEGLLPLDKAIQRSGLTEKEFKERLSNL